ncbi:MAG: hypothetical protein U0132_16160 [Gemmatimonadaceae bacterium]
MSEIKPVRVLYERPLPGGGYVQVEEDASAQAVHRGHVAVERRSDPDRREGHEPPIIASAEGASAQSVVRQLLEIATDNVAIARELLRRHMGGRARF